MIARALLLSCCVPLLGLTETPGLQAQGPALPTSDSATILAAGDIANCNFLAGAQATARLLDTLEGTILTLGDHAYLTGTAREFEDCYEPTWGRHKARTRPSPGNHDYLTDRARPYFAYFGDKAGPKDRGYYSFDAGAWHIISLNSTVSANSRSAQLKWLKEDLEAHPAACTLAYWHVPVFSSGPHGISPIMTNVWKVLYDASADVVLNGHDHDYERFAPQNPKGKADPERGIRQFVVGTGGGGVYRFGPTRANSEVRNNTAYGVLKLTLKPTSYDWEFIPVATQTFRDSGTGACVVLPDREPTPF
ncbi:MAG: metallophosphoesterase [Acidobacteria bacterium]|nr:metallophosphoesterase [Acidobacteriota bacterium]